MLEGGCRAPYQHKYINLTDVDVCVWPLSCETKTICLFFSKNSVTSPQIKCQLSFLTNKINKKSSIWYHSPIEFHVEYYFCRNPQNVILLSIRTQLPSAREREEPVKTVKSDPRFCFDYVIFGWKGSHGKSWVGSVCSLLWIRMLHHVLNQLIP